MLNKEDYEQIDNLIILSQIGSYKKNSLTNTLKIWLELDKFTEPWHYGELPQ